MGAFIATNDKIKNGNKMKKLIIIIALAAIAGVSVAGLFLHRSGDLPQSNSLTWRAVDKFNGVGSIEIKNAFSINESVWRIKWFAVSKAGAAQYSLFDMFIEQADSGVPVATAIMSQGSGCGIEHVFYETGTFNIRVIAANLESWTIFVDTT